MYVAALRDWPSTVLPTRNGEFSALKLQAAASFGYAFEIAESVTVSGAGAVWVRGIGWRRDDVQVWLAGLGQVHKEPLVVAGPLVVDPHRGVRGAAYHSDYAPSFEAWNTSCLGQTANAVASCIR